MMEIIMTRGDLEIRSFEIRAPDGSIYDETLDEIYFTVKKNANDRDYKIQKRLSDGGIMYMGDGTYQFTILPADTDGMAFGDYLFDIEIIKEGEIKKTCMGSMVLEREITHACNEGGNS